MEDACIYVTNFPHHNHYLFGVFDGHGGSPIPMQVLRSLSLFKDTLLLLFSITKISRKMSILFL